MSPAPPLPSPAELTGLARKYGALAALRRARDDGAPDPARADLRALAREFPGSLRELDTLGLPELRRRASAARAAAAGGPLEPWMALILAFHRLMSAALVIKGAGCARTARMDAATLAALGRRAETEAGVTLGADLVDAFVRPPGGRLVPIVLAEVATRFGLPPDAVTAALFPPRRKP